MIATKSLAGTTAFRSADMQSKAAALTNGAIPVVLLNGKGGERRLEDARRITAEGVETELRKAVEAKKKDDGRARDFLEGGAGPVVAETADAKDVLELFAGHWKRSVLVIDGREFESRELVGIIRELRETHGKKEDAAIMVVLEPSPGLGRKLAVLVAGANRLFIETAPGAEELHEEIGKLAEVSLRSVRAGEFFEEPRLN